MRSVYEQSVSHKMAGGSKAKYKYYKERKMPLPRVRSKYERPVKHHIRNRYERPVKHRMRRPTNLPDFPTIPSPFRWGIFRRKL